MKDASKILRSASHYQWRPDRHDAIFQLEDAQPHFTWDGKFDLTTADDINYQFDITTGEIVKVRPPRDQNTGWPMIAEIDRLCIAVPLVECPLPYAQLDTIVGLPKGSRYGGGASTGKTVFPEILLSDPKNPKGYYAIKMTVETADSITFPTDGRPATVESLSLVYVTVEGHTFQFVPGHSLARVLTKLKEELAAGKTTPRMLSERVQRGLNGRLIFED